MATAWVCVWQSARTQKYVTVVVKQRSFKGSFHFRRCIILIHKKERYLPTTTKQKLKMQMEKKKKEKKKKRKKKEKKP